MDVPHEEGRLVSDTPQETRLQEDALATYNLICNACSHTFEVFNQGFLRDKDKACPECASTDVRQTFSSFLRNIGSGSTSSSCGPRIGGFG
jgi:putative FmdB family regulatory protein